MRCVSCGVGRGQGHAQLAVRHHVGPVGERDRALRALLDEQHGDAAVADLQEHVEDDVDDRGSEPERRLVQEQDVGRGDERTRDRKLLLLTAGERARLPPPRVDDHWEQLPQPLEVGRLALAAVPADESEPQVLLDGQLGEDAPALGDERDAAARDRLRLPSSDRRAAEPDVAGAHADEADDRVQRRRLPRAVRADQADDLALADLEREVANGRHRAVVDAERLELECGRRGAHGGLVDGALAEVGSGDVEVVADFAGSPLGERPPLVEHVDAVADLHDQRHVVVDQQDAALVVVAHRADDGGEVGHLRLRQAGRRLVHEHEPGLHRERPRDAELPLVAVRERRGGPRVVGSEPEQLQQLRCAPSRLTGPRSRAEGSDLDVLAHGQRAERSAVLEGPREPGPAALARTPGRDRVVAERDRAGRREVEPRHHVDERRLAGAVRADQPDDLVAVHLQVDAPQGVHALEGARNGGGPETAPGPPIRLGRDVARQPQPEIEPSFFAV